MRIFTQGSKPRIRPHSAAAFGRPTSASVTRSASPRDCCEDEPSPVVVPRSDPDVQNMRAVIALTLAQHLDLQPLLLATGDAHIIEDCTKRASVSGLFWGAAWEAGAWQGRNTLGTLWMELRDDLRCRAR